MRIYFFSRKTLLTAAAVTLLAAGFLTFALIYYNHTGIASNAIDFKKPIFQGNSGEKAVALTVNVDWGEEFIPAMLKSFAATDARVTFFVTGKWAEKNPETLKQMHKAGHSIQNHGYKHCHFNNLTAEAGSGEIKKAEAIIKEITGQKSRFFASPYGEYSPNVVKAASDINYRLIMWSVDTIDWQRPDPQTIVNRVMKKIHNDAIILMHPTEPTVKALPDLLKQIKEENYKMVTIDKIIIEKEKNLDEGSNSRESH
ncbi:Polysaccharide deacetylase [Syntrophomonas zehnderi OL-4]|uniref:Polysaccharide deacetylase n=1 Tax=Syntrophomonas zehnderi OL-4 TaxID=690567 RepID=A0A0E4GBF6_9FIRM|nr:polysaccharide deacetylase family protein [Syntrophomonas zehnderi]CFX68051.1 Polysaccharide deacetylase [Syntrophomonas zehnderi OL-4]